MESNAAATTAAAATSSTNNAEARAANKYRFELELEFVQSLANPHYLQALAQQGVMEDPSFVLYLDYLQYWSKPEYAKFVIYPHALHHLQLLQNPKFRADLKVQEVLQLLVEKQFDHWRTWRSAPIQSLPTSSIPEQGDTQPPPAVAVAAVGVGRGGDIKEGHIGNGTTAGAASLPRSTPHPSSRRGTPRAGTGTPRAGGPGGTGTSRPGSNAPTPL